MKKMNLILGAMLILASVFAKADGYILKNTELTKEQAAQELEALKVVMAGRRYICHGDSGTRYPEGADLFGPAFAATNRIVIEGNDIKLDAFDTAGEGHRRIATTTKDGKAIETFVTQYVRLQETLTADGDVRNNPKLVKSYVARTISTCTLQDFHYF